METDDLLEIVTADLCARYRIEPAAARASAAEELAKTPAVAQAAREAISFERLKRQRIYKTFIQALRKKVYYDLRRYHGGETLAEIDLTKPDGVEAALQQHASTRERLAHIEAVWVGLRPHLAAARSVLDIGGGIFPLMAPFAELPDLERYHLLDRDAAAVDCVRNFAVAQNISQLRADQWTLGESWPPLPFDLALLLKFVPVIARQERERLPMLAQVPAQKIILSGAKISLTKTASIERRERALLHRFLETTRFDKISEFNTDDEIFLIAERPV